MFRKTLFVIMMAMSLLMVMPAAAQSQCSMFHTVERGDTLYRLSREFNVTVANLQSWNNLTNPNRILVGNELCVGRTTIVDDSSGTTYTVQRGDTLSRIARRFGVSMSVLAEVNDIRNPNRIFVGQVLDIPDVTIQ